LAVVLLDQRVDQAGVRDHRLDVAAQEQAEIVDARKLSGLFIAIFRRLLVGL
jgi:hypothetical protein